MSVIITVASGGPDWATIMTAFGTVAAAGAALWIALWSDRRTVRRIRAERQIAQDREQRAEGGRAGSTGSARCGR
jgi:hypothetical protein